MITQETASKDLSEFRIKYNFTLEKLQEKTGISRPTLIGIEKGTIKPQASTLHKLNNFIDLYPV